MAIESGIKIAVDDAAFGAFFTKFLQYKATLDNTPEAWKKVSVSAEAAKDAFSETAESAAAQADAIGRATDNVGHLRQASEAVGRTWHTMARDSGTMLRHVTEMTKTLLEWSGITGLVGGLFTVGSLTAFDSIASSITSQRTRALEGGTTIGRNTAADIAYGPLGGGSGFGAHIAQLQSSGQGLTYLAQLTGLPISQLQTMDPNDLQGVVLAAGQRLASGRSLQQLRSNPTLTQVFGGYLGTLNILHSPTVTQGVVQRDRELYQKIAPKFEIANPVAWANFLQVLTTAKSTIETAFINRMAALSEPMGKLVTAFQTAATKLIDSKLFDDILKRVNQGMEGLAKEIDKPSFQKGVEGFITSLGQLGPIFMSLTQDLIGFAKWLGVDVGKPNLSLPKVDHETGPLPSYDKFRKMVGSNASGSAWTGGSSEGSGKQAPETPFKSAGGPRSHAERGWWTPSREAHAYEKLRAAGLTDAGARGLISRWANVESAEGPSSINPRSGAFGIGQWLGARRRPIAGDTNFDDQLNYAIHELKTSEGRAFNTLRTARTDAQGAIGATEYERAEGYNPRTGTDDWTGKVYAGMSRIVTGDPQTETADASSSVKGTQPHKKTIAPKKGPSSPIFLTVFGIPGSDAAQTAGQASTFSAALQ